VPLTIFCSSSILSIRLRDLRVIGQKGLSFDADRPDDDLSPTSNAETLAERAMIPEGFAKYVGFEDGYACGGNQRWKISESQSERQSAH
jgi:hypothetical protein